MRQWAKVSSAMEILWFYGDIPYCYATQNSTVVWTDYTLDSFAMLTTDFVKAYYCADTQ